MVKLKRTLKRFFLQNERYIPTVWYTVSLQKEAAKRIAGKPETPHICPARATYQKKCPLIPRHTHQPPHCNAFPAFSNVTKFPRKLQNSEWYFKFYIYIYCCQNLNLLFKCAFQFMERHLITHWCHIRTNNAEEMFSLYTLYRVSYCPNLGVSLHSATILPTTSISRCWLSIFRQLIPYSGHLNSWKSPKHDIRTSKCVWLLSLTEQTDLHLIPLSRLCVKSKPIIRPKGRIRERNIVPSHLSILHFCAAHSIHICIPSLPC